MTSTKDFPAPLIGSEFTLREVKEFPVPHPYTIGAQHVAHASDHFSGRLGVDAIEEAEKKGVAHCMWDNGRCRLPFKEHRTEKALVIEVEQNHDLNAITGLHAYLLSIKAKAEELGVTGFAFPKKGQLL